MTASFTAEGCDVVVHAVKVEEGEGATRFSPLLELAVPEPPPGMLFRPGARIKALIINRSWGRKEGIMGYGLRAPLRGDVWSREKGFSCPPHSTVPIRLALPHQEGLFVLWYKFGAEEGKIRLSIGKPAPSGRNRPFFSATPPFAITPREKLLDYHMKALYRYGLGTLHPYMGVARMRDLLHSPTARMTINTASKHGLEWLFTVSDHRLLTGAMTQVPGPDKPPTAPIEVKGEALSGERVTSAQLKLLADWVKATARSYRREVRFWEILNEPNCFLTGEEYRKVLLSVSKAPRSVDKRFCIVGGSVVNAHRRELYKATMATPPGTFDCFSFHPYRFGLPNPESENMSYRRMIVEAKEDLAKAGHPASIFLTEEGMGPGLDETRCIGFRLSYSCRVRKVEWGRGEVIQALYGSRMYLSALGQGCKGYNYHTLGMLVEDRVMTPSVLLKALHTMASVLGDCEPLGRLELGRDIVGYFFRGGRRLSMAGIYMKDAEYGAPTTLTLKLPAGAKVGAFNMLGVSLPVRNTAEGWEIPFHRDILYMVIRGQGVDEARRAIQRAFLGLRISPSL